jgi:two-component system, NtrC family, nitrogen regulation sensor histidine kinase NtrY
MATATDRRKVWIVVLSVCLIVLFVALATLNAFKLSFLNPATTQQIVVFTALSIIAFLLFVAVLMLLVRNVLKLYADQRSRVMGTRLRTRMLWGALLVSLVPIASMFAFSYQLMNRAVDRWFSQPVTQMREDSNSMAAELAGYTASNARAEADSIASGLPAALSSAAAAGSESRSAKGVRGPVESGAVPVTSHRQAEVIYQVLRGHEITLQNGFAIVYRDGRVVASFHIPPRDGATAEVKTWLPDHIAEDGSSESGGAEAATDPTDAAILAAAQRSDGPVFSIGSTDYALGTATLKEGNTVVVGLPMPFGMAATMTRLRKAADAYWTLHTERRQIRDLYMLLLLMMTSLSLFASSWLALHLSKQVTKPVEALADAMEAIVSGDYGHRVKETATEELGELVRSFNHMAADLENSRRAVELSTVQLSAANSALEARSGEL